MLEAIRSQALPPGSNPRTDLNGSNWRYLLPRLDITAAAVHGDVDPPLLAALDEWGVERTRSGAELVVVAHGWDDGVPDAPLQVRVGGRGPVALARSGPPPGPTSSLVVPTVGGSPRRGVVQLQRVRRATARAARRVGLPARISDPADRTGTLRPVAVAPPIDGGVDVEVRARGEDLSALPRYVAAAAALGGVRLAPHRWEVLLEGSYRSQKVVFFVVDECTGTPLVVKVARHPMFTPRTENELAALSLLHASGLGALAPLPLFGARHAGCAVIGEEAVEGERFARRTTWGVEDPAAVRCLDVLRDLAVGARREVTRDEVRGALHDLLDRYVEAAGPPRPLAAFLSARIDEVSGSPLPATLQHGDPGTWNVLDQDGDIRILDWENAEAAGVPTWDTSFLLHTYALRALERQGRRRSIRTVEAFLLRDTRWSRWHAHELQRVADAIGVPRTSLPGLHVLGWLYQAVKDLPRRPAGSTAPGPADEVLRRCWSSWGSGFHAMLRTEPSSDAA